MLALVETLRLRVRNGLDTYVLFLDLQQAYGFVHRGALSHVLKGLLLAQTRFVRKSSPQRAAATVAAASWHWQRRVGPP